MALIDRLTAFTDPDVDRALATLPNRLNELGFDDWGFSREHARHLYALARQVYRYFRPEIHGLENVPRGRVLVVPNHSGQLPVDGLIIAVACLTMGQNPRLLRPMVERWAPRLPFVNEAFSRSGVVLGDPINCRNLLEDDQAILVFPEGAKGSGKPWAQRYQLQHFGRGFMRLALETRAPIVPVAVVGGEESIISLTDLKPLARLLKMPYVPISPLLPLLGPLAYFPMPVKFHVWFGPAMHFDGRHDDEDSVVDDKVVQVKRKIEELIAHGRKMRKGIFS